MTQYAALLRGVNVGGNNIIKMADLKGCFEALGFEDAATYIQSGNVVFEAASGKPADIATRLEEALSSTFGYHGRIVLRSHAQMRVIVEEAPAGFGSRPDLYRYDVVFLRAPLTVEEAMQELRARQGVDRVFAGDGVCYFSRLDERAGQSYLSKVIGLPVYKSMTIRNWNTTVKLLALLDARVT